MNLLQTFEDTEIKRNEWSWCHFLSFCLYCKTTCLLLKLQKDLHPQKLDWIFNYRANILFFANIIIPSIRKISHCGSAIHHLGIIYNTTNKYLMNPNLYRTYLQIKIRLNYFQNHKGLLSNVPTVSRPSPHLEQKIVGFINCKTALN